MRSPCERKRGAKKKTFFFHVVDFAFFSHFLPFQRLAFFRSPFSDHESGHQRVFSSLRTDRKRVETGNKQNYAVDDCFGAKLCRADGRQAVDDNDGGIECLPLLRR